MVRDVGLTVSLTLTVTLTLILALTVTLTLPLPLTLTRCEGVGRALAATLPQFISPYLPRLLRALLCAAALPTPAASAPASRHGAAHGAADASGAQLGAAVRYISPISLPYLPHISSTSPPYLRRAAGRGCARAAAGPKPQP